MHLRALALLGVALLLTACGAYQPPGPTPSSLQSRQTAQALRAEPTLAAVSAGVAPPPRPTMPPLAELLNLRPGDPRSLGDPAAPVTIVELTDYE